MSDAKRIRTTVEDFWRQNSIGESPADAFPAWWISTTFETSPQDAVRRCAVGTGDQGLDGYYLEQNAERGWILHLVQAKYSDSKTLVKKAIDGFKNTIPEVRRAVDRLEPERSNPHLVYSKLRADIDRNDIRAEGLRLHFHVIHLCDEPDDVVQLGSMAARDRFNDLARTTFPEMFFDLFIEGPDQLKGNGGNPPSEQLRLRFEGIELKSVSQTRYFTGLTYLSDLVDLYNDFGEQLFSKNVRYYLFKERGQTPARFMRDTLRAICVGPPEKAEIPEHFGMFHNGVTLAVHSFQCTDGTATVRNPSVLNGCQTIRNASRFLAEVRDIAPDRWRQVPVPVRILISADEEFIRRVTVNNNRQIPVRPSAFFANDRIQLALDLRFSSKKIYYERQQGGFQNLRVKEPRKLVEQFANSVAAPLTMEDLAQAIATASNKPSLSVAARVSSLFEESLYPQVFAEPKLLHLDLLVFLRNLLRTMKVALKDVRDRTSKLEGLPLERFRYPCTRILARYIVKYEPQLVADHGVEVYGHLGPTHPFRKQLTRLMSHQNSGLQQLISELWDDGEQWRKADDADVVRRALAKLKLENVDVFSEYEPDEED
jgi:hypothetical protein